MPIKKNIPNSGQLSLFYFETPFYGELDGYDENGNPVFIQKKKSRLKDSENDFVPLYFKKDFSRQIRPYQLKTRERVLFDNFQKKPLSTVIIFPPGAGKTYTAAMIMDSFLQNGNILVLSPLVGLSYQLEREFREMFDFPEERILAIGAKSERERRKIYGNFPKILISTPQSIVNDLRNSLLAWNFSMVLYDEADFGVGEYDYVRIGEYARKYGTFSLGLTATPGSLDTLKSMIMNLGFENLEIKLDSDSDIKPYRRGVEEKFIPCALGRDLLDLLQKVNKLIGDRERILQNGGYEIRSHEAYISNPDLERLRKKLDQEISLLRSQREKLKASFPGNSFLYDSRYQSLRDKINDLQRFVCANAQLYHLLQIRQRLLTESVFSTKQYIRDHLFQKKRWDTDPAYLLKKELSGISFLQELGAFKGELSKLTRFLTDIIAHRAYFEGLHSNTEGKRIPFKAIVLVDSRDQAKYLTQLLAEQQFFARVYVGRGEKGFTGKRQAEILKAYVYDEFHVLVATRKSLERGIDLPCADFLYILTQNASGKSLTQAKNRVNRGKISGKGKGLVYEYYTADTYEEKQFFVARKKEKRHEKDLSLIRDQIKKSLGKTQNLLEIVEKLISPKEEKRVFLKETFF